MIGKNDPTQSPSRRGLRIFRRQSRRVLAQGRVAMGFVQEWCRTVVGHDEAHQPSDFRPERNPELSLLQGAPGSAGVFHPSDSIDHTEHLKRTLGGIPTRGGTPLPTERIIVAKVDDPGLCQPVPYFGDSGGFSVDRGDFGNAALLSAAFKRSRSSGCSSSISFSDMRPVSQARFIG